MVRDAIALICGTFFLASAGNVLAQVDWDGGIGTWNSANWEGSQTASDVLGGDVNGGDFLKWQRGESSDPLSASDLADWEAAFGPPALQAVVSTTVPEPSSWLLALVASLSILGCFRRCPCLSVC